MTLLALTTPMMAGQMPMRGPPFNWGDSLAKRSPFDHTALSADQIS
jgi:hypothetical protein